MDLSKSTTDTILIWLVFTDLSTHCGKAAVTRRLIEWNKVSKKLVYVYPLERRGISIPNDSFLKGRPYYRLHQLDPNPMKDDEFLKQCNNAGVIPRGVRVS